MEREYAEYLLKKTKEDYSLISENFSKTRGQVWGEMKFLEDYVTAGEKILDLGCGNGRLYELFKEKAIKYYGIDISERMIEIAKNRYLRSPKIFNEKFKQARAEFQVADALNLPFPNNFFDKIFSVAVFHHIPSQEFRLQFLEEAKRILKAGGKLILAVWNLDVLIKFPLILKYTILKIFGKSKLDFGDIFLPWQKEVPRYIHRFSKNELKKLSQKTGLEVKEIKILKRPRSKESNILLVAEK